MSRSKRKSPVTGFTGCKSEKDDKRIARRVLRNANSKVLKEVKSLYETGVEEDTKYQEPVFYLLREVSSVWSFGKDGKMRFSSWRMDDKKTYDKLMRK